MSNYGWRDNSIKTKKLQVKGKMPVQFTIPKSAAVGSASIMTGWDVSATAAKANADFVAQPPYPVRLSLYPTVGGTADNSDAITVVGQNAYGETVTESISIASTAKGQTYSVNAFAHIDSITPDAANACTDLGVGISSGIGLPWPIESTADIVNYCYDGAYATAARGIASIDTTYNIFKPSTWATDIALQLTYMSKVQNI